MRTFYWQSDLKHTRGRFRFQRPAPVPWKVGNAGDIYSADLVRHLYSREPENVDAFGRRVLLVGSILKRMLPGDVVAGAGAKGPDALPPASEAPATIYGVRGPLTVGALRDAGHDTSRIRFQLDPGLLVADVFPELRDVAPERGRIAFVPHYRERPQYRDSRKYVIVDADATPLDFAREIARSEVVYASSLHGVIFAHALGRPAVLVAPRTNEPEFKYRDYYASVGLDWSTPDDIGASLKRGRPQLPSTIAELVATAAFPTEDELRRSGILT